MGIKPIALLICNLDPQGLEDLEGLRLTDFFFVFNMIQRWKRGVKVVVVEEVVAMLSG